MKSPELRFEGLSSDEKGVVVYVVVKTGGVPRFEHVRIPWICLIETTLMRELVTRHTRSMEAPAPWSEGDVTDPLC